MPREFHEDAASSRPIRSFLAPPVKRLAWILVALALAAFSSCDTQTPYRKARLNSARTAAGPMKQEKVEGILRLVVAPIMSPTETNRIYGGLMSYLESKLGRSVRLIQGSTYTEINELVRTGACDVAFVCSYAYLVGQRDFGMEALVIPVMEGDVWYHSCIIVPAGSPVRTWRDLRNKAFAFTDPLSNTGYLAPRYLVLYGGEDPNRFFRETIFTYSHDNSIRAVADKLVDGAAVDDRVLKQVLASRPEIEKQISIISVSESFGIPPVVVPPQVQPELKEELRQAFLVMEQDPLGRKALGGLMVDRFVLPDDRLYDSTRRMMAELLEKR